MPQVNVEFDNDTVKSLDRIAAKQSIRRPELLRRTVRELINAESDGRELFSAPLQEIRAEDLGSGLVDYSQKMTVAARATAEKKAVGQRS